MKCDASIIASDPSPSSHTGKKIWIDLENTPHVPFFIPIIDELTKQGYRVILTARDCFQVCELADMFGLNCTRIGRHYGKNPLLKCVGVLIRSAQLLPAALRQKPDFSLSHGSRAQLLVSWTLGIPNCLISDYEHGSWFNSGTWNILPEVVKGSLNGFSSDRIRTYPGIKEDVYVPAFKPDSNILKALGISEQDLVVTIRPPATEAHYHNPESETLLTAMIEQVAQDPRTRIVALPRTERQKESIRTIFPDLCHDRKIIFPAQVVNGLNLLWHSDVVVSGGGTINREAAALGVPVYSIFRGEIGAVDKYLSKEGRLILLTCLEDIRTKFVLQRRSRQTTLPKRNNAVLKSIVEHVVFMVENS